MEKKQRIGSAHREENKRTPNHCTSSLRWLHVGGSAYLMESMYNSNNVYALYFNNKAIYVLNVHNSHIEETATGSAGKPCFPTKLSTFCERELNNFIFFMLSKIYFNIVSTYFIMHSPITKNMEKFFQVFSLIPDIILENQF